MSAHGPCATAKAMHASAATIPKEASDLLHPPCQPVACRRPRTGLLNNQACPTCNTRTNLTAFTGEHSAATCMRASDTPPPPPQLPVPCIPIDPHWPTVQPPPEIALAGMQYSRQSVEAPLYKPSIPGTETKTTRLVPSTCCWSNTNGSRMRTHAGACGTHTISQGSIQQYRQQTRA